MSSTKEKALINWNFTCQLPRIYENFKEGYFRSTQIIRLHEAMQEELKKASYSEQVQTFTLVTDKCTCQMYC